MLSKRENQILMKLYENAPGVYTSEALSTLLNVSSRTIKNDIENIRGFLENHDVAIHSERGRGYWINLEDKKKISKELNYHLLNEVSRENTEIIEFILFRKKYIPVYEVAEKFFYSESILLKKIDEINLDLELYDLKIVKEPRKGIKLVGNEKNQRIMYAQILKKDNILENGRFKIKDKSLFDHIEKIQNVLLEFQRKHEIGLSDIARTGLILDVVVTLKRIETNQNISMTDEEMEDLKSDKEWFYAIDLANMLEEAFDVKFKKSEIGFLSIHLLSANLANDKLPSTFNEIEDQIDSELFERIIKWIRKLDSEFNTNLENDIEFISGLALHIKPLLKRIKFKMNLKNPWIKELKEEHQMAYEMAVLLAQEIQRDFNKSITENEVAYLAMHIGGALEKHSNTEKIDTVIICSSGIGTSNFLRARLKRIYPQFNVIGVYSTYSDEINTLNNHLIITTVPIHSEKNNIIQVSPILSEEDQNLIESYLNKSHINDLDLYFKEEIFTIGFRAESKVEVIKHASLLLYENGYVDENYYLSVLEREALSSTEVGNLIVIPHAFSGNIKKQGVCVTILEKPIVWENDLVQIIFTLALDAKRGEDFSMIFEKITNLRDNLELINQMVRINNFEEFKYLFNRG